jgi:hypothetical protein
VDAVLAFWAPSTEITSAEEPSISRPAAVAVWLRTSSVALSKLNLESKRLRPRQCALWLCADPVFCFRYTLFSNSMEFIYKLTMCDVFIGHCRVESSRWSRWNHAWSCRNRSCCSTQHESEPREELNCGKLKIGFGFNFT